MQRGNVKWSNLQAPNAMLYVVEHGCKWRGLPAHLGNWATGTPSTPACAAGPGLACLAVSLPSCKRSQIARIKIEAVSPDNTSIKVHPDGTGALKKRPPSHRQAQRRTQLPKIHLVTANDRTALKLSLSPGRAHDAPQGRALLQQLRPPSPPRQRRKRTACAAFVPNWPIQKSFPAANARPASCG